MGFFEDMEDPGIDRSHPVNLFRQIAEVIRAGIEAGELVPGEKLPGERELAVLLT